VFGSHAIAGVFSITVALWPLWRLL
jgi:hypothetical protein